MKSLLKQKEIKTTQTVIDQDALNDVAMELIKGNHKTMSWQINREIFREDETEVELLVGDGYEVTIKQTRMRGIR